MKNQGWFPSRATQPFCYVYPLMKPKQPPPPCYFVGLVKQNPNPKKSNPFPLSFPVRTQTPKTLSSSLISSRRMLPELSPPASPTFFDGCWRPALHFAAPVPLSRVVVFVFVLCCRGVARVRQRCCRWSCWLLAPLWATATITLLVVLVVAAVEASKLLLSVLRVAALVSRGISTSFFSS